MKGDQEKIEEAIQDLKLDVEEDKEKKDDENGKTKPKGVPEPLLK